MRVLEDLSGRRFGKLTALHRTKHKDKWGKYYWKCLCACGKTSEVVGSNLKIKIRSCGCSRVSKRGVLYTFHGKSKTDSYKTWQRMIRRCYSKDETGYHNYGGRGIDVCEKWQTFVPFYRDMGERPEGTSLDRIDNSKGYSPDNCRWGTAEEQANNKRNNAILRFGGTALTIAEWGRHLDIKTSTLHSRLRRGWSHEQVLITPPSRSNWTHRKRSVENRRLNADTKAD